MLSFGQWDQTIHDSRGGCGRGWGWVISNTPPPEKILSLYPPPKKFWAKNGKICPKNVIFCKFFDQPSRFSQICCKISWKFHEKSKNFLLPLPPPAPPPPKIFGGAHVWIKLTAIGWNNHCWSAKVLYINTVVVIVLYKIIYQAFSTSYKWI